MTSCQPDFPSLISLILTELMVSLEEAITPSPNNPYQHSTHCLLIPYFGSFSYVFSPYSSRLALCLSYIYIYIYALDLTTCKMGLLCLTLFIKAFEKWEQQLFFFHSRLLSSSSPHPSCRAQPRRSPLTLRLVGLS